MPWSAGTYTKGNNATGGWVGDAALSIGIEAGRHDTQDNDFATGINQCLNKDGSNTCTGNMNFGGFLPANIGAGTAAAPAICAGNDIDTGIYAPAVNTWAVATNGSHRLRIDSSGNVGIGTTSPTNRLTVGDGSAIQGVDVNGSNSGTSGGAYFLVKNAATNICGIGNFSALFGGGYNGTSTLWSNAVGWRVTNLGTGAGTHAMRYDTGSGAWTYDTSSVRYKKDIVGSPYGLDSVLSLQPRAFKYKDSDRPDIGFIAEEVVQVIPEVVAMDSNNQPDAVSYDRLTSVLCKAIQELNAKVDALQAQVNAL